MIPRTDKLAPEAPRSTGQRTLHIEKIVEPELTNAISALVPAQTLLSHDVLGHTGVYEIQSTTGLTVTLGAGKTRLDATVYSHSITTLTAAASTTNYIFVSASGVLLLSTSTGGTGTIPLYEIDTDATSVQAIRDKRCIIQNGQSGGGGGGGGGTLDTAYDFGGFGAGRTINVTDNPVLLLNQEADTNPSLELQRGAGTVLAAPGGGAGSIIGAKLATDQQYQWEVLVGGTQRFGAGGSSVFDTQLDRMGVSNLRISGQTTSGAGHLRVTGYLELGTATVTSTTNYYAFVLGLSSNPGVTIAPASGGAGGSLFTGVGGILNYQPRDSTGDSTVAGLNFEARCIMTTAQMVDTSNNTLGILAGCSARVGILALAIGSGTRTINITEMSAFYAPLMFQTISGAGTTNFNITDQAGLIVKGGSVNAAGAELAITNWYGVKVDAMTNYGRITNFYPYYADGLASTSDAVGSAHRLNFQFGHTTRSFGGGDGVIGIRDATTAPTANPTNGGVLYSAAGALKWRGSAGTVTTIAAA